MSVKFKPTQIAMPLSANYGRWYAKAVTLNNVTTKELTDYGTQNIRSYHVNYQPFRHFVGNGQVSDKNRRKGTKGTIHVFVLYELFRLSKQNYKVVCYIA
jgi:hypothetical protein